MSEKKSVADIARVLLHFPLRRPEPVAKPSPILTISAPTGPVRTNWPKPLPSCATCPLYTEPGPVWGTGPEDAESAWVAEGPGMEEVDYSLFRPSKFAPLVGGTGRIYNAMLSHAGVARTAIYVTNAVKCWPNVGRMSYRTPTADEIAHCAPILEAELEALNPNVVVALGDVPLHVLTGKTGITNRRGVPILGGYIGSKTRKVFPTWNPAAIARQQYNWPFAVHDYQRAIGEASFPELRKVPFEIIRTSNTPEGRAGILEAARARGATTFDFETTGLDAKTSMIAMVGLTTGPNTAHVLDMTGGARQLFQRILDDPLIELVGQNITYFDLPYAEGKGFDISKAWPKVFDTMSAFHLCNSSYGTASAKDQAKGKGGRGMDKDLTMIASCHTDIEYWKAKSAYAADLKGVCGTDCVATDRSALDPRTGLKAELASLDMTDLYYKHVLPVQPVLHAMHKRGIRVDEDHAARWSILCEQVADDLEAKLRQQLGMPTLNFRSPKQMIDLLYNRLKLPPQFQDDRGGRRGHSGQLTANANALMILADLAPENAALASIIDIRQLRQMKSTFIDPALRAGRVHPHFGDAKTSTGRFNSWDPNAQNIPEIFRGMYVPDKDHVLIAADWSQIEWRLSMVLSGDRVGLEMLAKGIDTHKAIAADALGIPISEVSPAQRQGAKFIVYGVAYGRGATSLSEGRRDQSGGSTRAKMTMTPDFVRSFITRFFGRMPEYARWRDSRVEFAQRHHYLANAFKRRRLWYGFADGNATEQYAFDPQSNAGDMMHVVIVEVNDQLPKGATLRLTVHDELVISSPKELAKEALACVRSVMQRTWPQIVAASAHPENVKRFYPNGWFCPVDAHVASNWKACKGKDPEDLADRAQLARELALTEA